MNVFHVELEGSAKNGKNFTGNKCLTIVNDEQISHLPIFAVSYQTLSYWNVFYHISTISISIVNKYYGNEKKKFTKHGKKLDT